MAEHRVVQISDIHLTTSGSLGKGFKPRANLVAGLQQLEQADVRPDVFVLTGDLADIGEPTCYDDLRALMDKAASAADAIVIYLPGNHDARATFRSHLLQTTASDAPINQIHWRDGLRIISLDSVIEGTDVGELGPQTLEFLRDALAQAAPDGTLLAVHHPPIPSPIEPMARIMLRDADQLNAVIAGSDVRLVICGHNHHDALGQVGSIPVWVSPAVAYRADVMSRHHFRPIPGAAFSQIDLLAAGTTAGVVPIDLAEMG